MRTLLLLLMASLTTLTYATPGPKLASAGAGTTELILALDGGAHLRAVDDTSELPQTLMQLPRLGYHRQLSAEGVIASGAQMLVGSHEMGPDKTLDLVRQAQIQVVALPPAASGHQLLANIEQLARLLQRPANGSQLAAQVSQRLAALGETRQQLAKHPPKVLFVLIQGERPLRAGGQGTSADLLIQLAGGRNVAQFSGYKSLSAEGIVALAPELLLVSARDANSSSMTAHLLTAQPLLSHTPAGQHGRIMAVAPQALMGGLGLSALTATEQLAQQLRLLRNPG